MEVLQALAGWLGQHSDLLIVLSNVIIAFANLFLSVHNHRLTKATKQGAERSFRPVLIAQLAEPDASHDFRVKTSYPPTKTGRQFPVIEIVNVGAGPALAVRLEGWDASRQRLLLKTPALKAGDQIGFKYYNTQSGGEAAVPENAFSLYYGDIFRNRYVTTFSVQQQESSDYAQREIDNRSFALDQHVKKLPRPSAWRQVVGRYMMKRRPEPKPHASSQWR